MKVGNSRIRGNLEVAKLFLPESCKRIAVRAALSLTSSSNRLYQVLEVL